MSRFLPTQDTQIIKIKQANTDYPVHMADADTIRVSTTARDVFIKGIGVAHNVGLHMRPRSVEHFHADAEDNVSIRSVRPTTVYITQGYMK